MGRGSAEISELGLGETDTREAIPLEYRYSTGLLGATLVGVGLLSLALVFLRGPAACALAVVSLAAMLPGLLGVSADPTGVVRSAGRRLVIDDCFLQEVTETGRVEWSISPDQVAEVHEVPGRRVLPFVAAGWRAESWIMILDTGRVIRIPVWLLPHSGYRFKQRFRAFLARRAQADSRSAQA